MDMGGPRTSLCCTRGQLRDDLTSCVKRNHWRIQVLLFAGTLAKMVSNGIASFLLYTDHILDHTVCLLMKPVSPKIGLKRNSLSLFHKPIQVWNNLDQSDCFFCSTYLKVARMLLYHFRFRPF